MSDAHRSISCSCALPRRPSRQEHLSRSDRFAKFHSTTETSKRSKEFPGPVQQLKDRLAAADGLLIVTPEYNNSIPGVLKNAIDWLSRPASDIPRVFRGRPVAIMGATPGQGGTLLAQAAWLPVLRTLGMLPWFEGRLGISGAGKVFDTGGQIVDAAMRDRIRTFVTGFAAFADVPRAYQSSIRSKS